MFVYYNEKNLGTLKKALLIYKQIVKITEKCWIWMRLY